MNTCLALDPPSIVAGADALVHLTTTVRESAPAPDTPGGGRGVRNIRVELLGSPWIADIRVRGEHAQHPLTGGLSVVLGDLAAAETRSLVAALRVNPMPASPEGTLLLDVRVHAERLRGRGVEPLYEHHLVRIRVVPPSLRLWGRSGRAFHAPSPTRRGLR